MKAIKLILFSIIMFISIISSVNSVTYISDDFNRNNNDTVGVSNTGQTWIETDTYGTTSIENNQLKLYDSSGSQFPLINISLSEPLLLPMLNYSIYLNSGNPRGDLWVYSSNMKRIIGVVFHPTGGIRIYEGGGFSTITNPYLREHQYNITLYFDYDTQKIIINIDGSNYTNYDFYESEATNISFIKFQSGTSETGTYFINYINIYDNLSIPNENITINNIYPLENDHLNDNPLLILYNVSWTEDNIYCRLDFDGIEEYDFINVTTNTINNFSVDMTFYDDGEHYYQINCKDIINESLSNVYNSDGFIYDKVNPDFHLLSFVNDSYLNYIDNPYIYLHDTFDDLYLFQVNYTLYLPNGSVYYNEENLNVSAQWYNISHIINTSLLPNGTYTLDVYATDTNTAKKLKDLPYDKKINGLTYFTDKNRIDIDFYGDVNDIDNIETKKEYDRYTFDFNFKSKSKKKFMIKCQEKIYSMEKLYPYPLFNCGKYGIDFNYNNGSYVNYTLSRLDDYTYLIELLEENNKLKFKSLVGLNTIHETYYFHVTESQVTHIVIDNPTDLTGIQTSIDNLKNDIVDNVGEKMSMALIILLSIFMYLIYFMFNKDGTMEWVRAVATILLIPVMISYFGTQKIVAIGLLIWILIQLFIKTDARKSSNVS